MFSLTGGLRERNMRNSLNSLKGTYKDVIQGSMIGVINKGDNRGLHPKP